MKVTKLLFLLTFILAGFSFSSCSSDDNDDNGGASYSFGAKNVFTGDLPKAIGSSATKYNSEGLLEEISSNEKKITFEYPPKAKSTNSSNIVIMKMSDLNNPQNNYTIRIEIGSNGFASNALQTYADNSTDTWEFKYNSDGQLNYMKRSEGNNEATSVTYTNGNITSIKMESDDTKDDVYTSAITYTSENYSKGIENKGCVMLFDITFGIDIDEMSHAYYAGLLGRATKNLPLKIDFKHVGETVYNGTYLFNWTLNEKGYPTKLSYERNDESFSW